MSAPPTTTREQINLTDPEFWARPLIERDAAFKVLRAEDPIAAFDEPSLVVPGEVTGEQYLVITRHADLVAISRDPEHFCSGRGATSIPDMPTEMLEFYGSMINMDDPRHARLRGIVSRRFTPRMLQRALDDVEVAAVEVIDGVVAKGEIDLVAEISSPFPLRIICDLMGIPASERGFILEQTNIILSGGDPEFLGDDPTTWIGQFIEAGANVATLMRDLATARASDPGEDLTSALVNAEIDGEHLTGDELASFFILLAAAGNETTRTAISHGVLAFDANPDQRERWMDDFDALAPTAVDEIVRWASPVIWMRRTATGDVDVGGHHFTEGDKVILLYSSANRDEAVFVDADRFDVGRDPNPHLGFGAPGPHFCLGAHLARRELTMIFREMFRRLPDLTVAGEPDRLLSNFINGVKRLPVRFTTSRPTGSAR